MHSVMGMMTALMVSATGAGDEAASSSTVPEMEQRLTFVGLAVPLSPSGLAVEGERTLGKRFSMSLGLRVGFNVGLVSSASFLGGPQQSFLNVGVEPGARFYLTGSALDGLWLGPRLELGNTWRDWSGTSTSQWGLGGALLTGYSIRMGQGFCVQAALGVGMTYLSDPGVRISLPGGEQLPLTSSSLSLGHRAQVAVGWIF